MSPASLAASESDVVLRPSMRKLLRYMLGCAVFVAIGIFALARDEGPIGWMCVAPFSVGLLVFAVQLLPNASYLRLTNSGFEFCSMFRKSDLIPWGDVSHFRVAAVPPSTTNLVVYDLEKPSAHAHRRVNRALIGASDALPDTYGLDAEELADVMNSWRHRALTR